MALGKAWLFADVFGCSARYLPRRSVFFNPLFFCLVYVLNLVLDIGKDLFGVSA